MIQISFPAVKLNYTEEHLFHVHFHLVYYISVNRPNLFHLVVACAVFLSLILYSTYILSFFNFFLGRGPSPNPPQ